MRSLVFGLVAAASCMAQSASMFEFHSGFWVNLHHYLYQQASAQDTPPPEWRAAVEFYRESIIESDLLDDEPARVNLLLSRQENPASLEDSGLPDDLALTLNAIAPTYRDGLWPEHNRINQAWIRAAGPLLEKHESALRQALERVLDMRWPDTPTRTDVSVAANRVGAYTTLGPTHITISSTNPAYQGNGALEVLFHEAGHALIGRVRNVLGAEARSQNRLFLGSDLWHAILFFTAGETVKGRIEGYVPYAVKNELYTADGTGCSRSFQRIGRPT